MLASTCLSSLYAWLVFFVINQSVVIILSDTEYKRPVKLSQYLQQNIQKLLLLIKWQEMGIGLQMSPPFKRIKVDN